MITKYPNMHYGYYRPTQLSAEHRRKHLSLCGYQLKLSSPGK